MHLTTRRALLTLLALSTYASAQAWPPVDTPHLDLGANYGRLTDGDLNGDGHTDLVLTNGNTGRLSVALGHGGGEFRPARLVAAPAANLLNCLVAELDGDGDLDVAALQHFGPETPGTIHVLRGDGAGGLSPLTSRDVGWAPRVHAAADLDGDGITDLVASCLDAAGVSVLRGTGGGRFARQVRYDAGELPYGLTLGDVNGDGVIDALVGSRDLGTLHQLTGDGATGFGPPLAIETTAYPASLAMGDLDGDGDLDLVSATTETWSLPAVHANLNGSMVMQIDAVSGVPEFPGHVTVALGDLDGDGVLDLMTNGGMVRTFIGDGRLGFSAAGLHATASSSVDLVVDDLDGDGWLDVGTGPKGNASDSMFTLLRGTGTGTLRSTQWNAERDIAVADFDADGRADLAAFRDNGDIVAMTGLPGGGFGPQVFSEGISFAGRMEPGDFDGDGLADLVISANSRPWYLAGLGGAAFAAPEAIAPNCSSSGPIPAVGDIDGDGDLDLVTACFYKTFVFLGGGDGTFVPGENYPPPAPYSGAAKYVAELLDVDLDGQLDVVEVLSEQVASRRGLGDGTFEDPVSSAIPGSFLRAAFGDADRDGDPDVVVASTQPDSVALLRNDGSGAFTFAGDVFVGTTDLRAMLLHDLDGDGVTDLAVADDSAVDGGQLHCLRGLGDGTFGLPASLRTSAAPRRMSATDLDADGAPEIIVAGLGDTTVHAGLGGN